MKRLLSISMLSLLATLVVAPAAGQAAVASPARGTTIRATEAVNIRSGPSTSEPVVATAAAGDTASALGRSSGDFIEVYHRHGRGWTHGAYWNAVPGLWLNGYQLSSHQEAAVRWMAANTLARVPGTLSQQLTIVSRVTWWSLKEGILSRSLTEVHRFSNCDDSIYDPLHWCGTLNWQVGVGGTYMGNVYSSYDKTAEIQALALRLYPNWTLAQVLDHTANYAGYPDGSTGYNRIVSSTGSFKNSWLLRNHGVGATFNEPYVRSCLSNAPYWCYGGWDDAVRYAPNQNAITRVIQETRAILYALRPI